MTINNFSIDRLVLDGINLGPDQIYELASLLETELTQQLSQMNNSQREISIDRLVVDANRDVIGSKVSLQSLSRHLSNKLTQTLCENDK